MLHGPIRPPIRSPKDSPIRCYPDDSTSAPTPSVTVISLPGFDYPEQPVVDGNVDLLFDVAFQSGYKEYSTFSRSGIFVTEANVTPTVGTLESIVPSSFFEDGMISNGEYSYPYNSFCMYDSSIESKNDGYVYVAGISSQMDAANLNSSGCVARLYQRDVLIAESSDPNISAHSTDGISSTKIVFPFPDITLVEHDHYRVRIFDENPPVDMQMLFGVEGVVSDVGDADGIGKGVGAIGVVWDRSGAIGGTISSFSPDFLANQTNDPPNIMASYADGTARLYIAAQYSEDRGSIVAKGTSFDYANQLVTVRVYGDGVLLSETEGTWSYYNYSYVFDQTIEELAFADGQTIAVRGWVPTSAIKPSAPVVLANGVLVGDVVEGHDVKMEAVVWGNALAGIASDLVEWYIYDGAEDGASLFTSIVLDAGTPWTLPVGSANKWLTCRSSRTVWVDDEHTSNSTGRSKYLPRQLINSNIIT